jgi:hypothetical protein
MGMPLAMIGGLVLGPTPEIRIAIVSLRCLLLWLFLGFCFMSPNSYFLLLSFVLSISHTCHLSIDFQALSSHSLQNHYQIPLESQVRDEICWLLGLNNSLVQSVLIFNDSSRKGGGNVMLK